MNRTIENNIFGYSPIGAIRFTHIPPEIKISILYLENAGGGVVGEEEVGREDMEGDEGNRDEIQLINGALILCSKDETSNLCNKKLENEKILIIEPNSDIIKNSDYYYIDYQYIVVEEISNSDNPGAQTPDTSDISGTTDSPTNDQNQDTTGDTSGDSSRLLDGGRQNGLGSPSSEPKMNYGRTNRLKFILCHEFCATCEELGSNDNDQKCETCLPDYQYNYLAYFSDEIEEKIKNICVPEDYYYDETDKVLKKCNSTTYFFLIDKNTQRKFCYKKGEDNDSPCPEEYSFFNEENNECVDCHNSDDYFFYIDIEDNKEKCLKKEANNKCPSLYPLYKEINHQCISKIDDCTYI